MLKNVTNLINQILLTIKTFTKMKKMYIAPAVEVLDVMVEQGFAASVVVEGGGFPFSDEIED